MQKLIGNMARMYPLMIAMGLMIVVLAFVIGYFNSQAAAAYYAGAKGLRETTLMAQRVSLASTGLWLPAFKFLGLGLILGGIVMALRVIIDSLRAAGAKVLSNLPAERRPQLPGPPWYGRLMPLVMMLGMAFLFTAITLALTVIIGTLRMQARHLVGFYRQASGQTEPAGSDALAGKPELVPGGVAAD